MARIHDRFVAERKKNLSNRVDERRVIASRQVRTTDGSCEERVAHKQVRSLVCRARNFCPDDRQFLIHSKADAAGTVAWRVMRSSGTIAEANDFVRYIEAIDRRRLFDRNTEQSSLFDGLFVQKQILAVEIHRHAERALGRANTGDMVHVCMRQEDVGERDSFARGEREQAADFVAWIDEHAFACPRTCHDEPVLEERLDGLRLDYDHGVILAILDDLLFTSKMRATAKLIGATLSVAKSRDAALEGMRAAPPALVIFDLNNPRTDPLGIVAAMKSDPALAEIPTVGFVSHVQTDLIDAARKAGVAEVMARSMFAERLPQILAKGL